MLIVGEDLVRLIMVIRGGVRNLVLRASRGRYELDEKNRLNFIGVRKGDEEL